MKITILNASMDYSKEAGYVGRVAFEVEGHKQAYEITLQSRKRTEWGYALNYLDGDGVDEEIEAVDEYLDENDEAFDMLVQAAEDAYEHQSS